MARPSRPGAEALFGQRAAAAEGAASVSPGRPGWGENRWVLVGNRLGTAWGAPIVRFGMEHAALSGDGREPHAATPTSWTGHQTSVLHPHQVDGEDCPVGPEDCPSGPRSLPDTTGTDGDSDNMTLSDPSLPPGVTPTNSQGSPIPTEEAARRKCGEPHFGGPSGHQCPPSPPPLLYLGAYADEWARGRGGVHDLPACDWRGTPMTGTGAP